MNIIQQHDIREFVKTFELSENIQNSTFLITGATGLIGSSVIFCLLELNKNIKIIAPIRNKKKAELLFEEKLEQINFIECDIVSFDYERIGQVDYIIHCAAPTSSRFFVEKPVETFEIILQGTKVLLEYAKKNLRKGFVYLSSLEVYGEIQNDNDRITEDYQGYINPLSIRSSYPMAKRAAENLCCLFAKEYNVPVKIARLTQTTGAGIAKDDNRVIAQFTRMATEGCDIILHTKGDSARPYCYVTDCVSAILYVLIKGVQGEAYNISNDSTYISARMLAEFIRDNVNPLIQVKIELNGNMGYAPPTKHRLSSEKIMQLGWHPQYDLKEIIKRLKDYLIS